MKKKIITIDNNNTKVIIHSLTEDPFIRISVKGWRIDAPNQHATIRYTINYLSGRIDSDEFYFRQHSTHNEINSPVIKSVELELVESFPDFSANFVVQQGRDLIQNENPLSQFKDFLSDRVNSRILFSGAFGQGKTTFLNIFFDEKYKDNYNVFQVFPVNYSIASNEDIFRYIKTDILFQLLGRDIAFDEKNISFFQSLQEYIYLNPKATITSFLKSVSHLNTTTGMLLKATETINKFITDVVAYKEEQNKNDYQTAVKYLNDISEKEGSLFEDNFYTQLIRQLLEQLNEKTQKPNILVIEDLDRMDPDHIFRILNVISAHYDTYKFNNETDNSNKFGFDKIILVCDIDNIQNIFHHKYGEKTDFWGYINKYYSSKPYRFNVETKSILEFLKIQVEEKMPSNKHFLQILNLLYIEEQISLREILKLTFHDFNEYYVELQANDLNLRRSPFTKALAFLSEMYTSKMLINKFERIKSKGGKQHDFPYHDNALLLLGALGSSRETSIITHYKDVIYRCESQNFYDESVFYSINIIESSKVNNNATEILAFTKSDFYDLLIENVNKINELHLKKA